MKRLWQESRGNTIGGLIVAAVLALISWLSTFYASVGTKPFVIGILVLLWLGYLGYVGYWVSKRRQRGSTPGATDEHPESQASHADQPQSTHEQPGLYYPCFISYSHKDEEFAQQLYADLQKHNVRCWYAPEDIKIGDKIRSTIEQSIQTREKLLLVLSTHSIDSAWVEKEVETAFEKEQKLKQLVLFPIRLDSAVMDTDQAWAADIRRMRHIGDFSQWHNPDAYQKALSRLLRDLKAKDGEAQGEL